MVMNGLGYMSEWKIQKNIYIGQIDKGTLKGKVGGERIRGEKQTRSVSHKLGFWCQESMRD